MGEKIIIADYVGFSEPQSGELEQNQNSLPIIPIGNPTTDTLPNRVIALDVQPYKTFTVGALQNLHSLSDDNLLLVIENDIENISDNQNETFLQRYRATINLCIILFCVAILVFFLFFGF